MYFAPWLWYDGDQHGGFDYSLWESMITGRMAMDAPVTIAMWGNYTPSTGEGTVNVYLQNDSSAAIDSRVIIVITEDSLFYMAPNGVNWHNHVPRDYLPDHNGSLVSIPPGNYAIVTQPFTINSIWNDNYCTILAWIQNDSMQVDTTMEIWQGGMKKVTELGIEEVNKDVKSSQVLVMPNPCVGETKFFFDLPAGFEYTISIYDVSGRLIRIFDRLIDNQATMTWDCRDETGKKVSSGIYFVTLESENYKDAQKIIVIE